MRSWSWTAGVGVSLKDRAHRELWQRLPRGLRRAALFRASAWMAPRPTPTAAAGKPVIVAGSLSTASGLGNSARLCHDALKAAGLPVLGIDLTGWLMQPADFPDFAFSDGGGIDGPGTLVVHVNAPLMGLAMLRLGHRLVRGKRIVGYWAWELPEAPAEWRHGAAFVHEVWVPSAFTAEAVGPVAADLPVCVVPHPVATHRSGPFARKAAGEGPFTALTIFDAASSFARKNPCAAIRAFRLAFGDDEGARLIVKSTRLSRPPGCARTAGGGQRRCPQHRGHRRHHEPDTTRRPLRCRRMWSCPSTARRGSASSLRKPCCGASP